MGLRTGTIALVFGFVFALASAPAAHAADAFYGTFTSNMSLPAAQLSAQMNAQSATGAGVVREHLYWDRIERSPGVFDWTDADALFAAAIARGMTVLPILTDTPAFYTTRPAGATANGWPPRDPAMIKRFTTELTKRYGTRGTYWGCLLPGLLCRRQYKPILAWQVWNEPDLLAWWRTGPNPAGYTALLAQAYSGLKAGDASAEVVLGGLSFHALDETNYLAQLYDNGAAAYFDTLAIHPYAGNVSGVVNVIRRTREIATAKGDAGVPIRITEYGYATGGNIRPWVVSDERCQAALINATTLELSARRTELGLKSIVQFQWQDRSTDLASAWANFAGMLRYNGTAKPGLKAFSDAIAGRPMAAGSTVNDVCPTANRG